MYNPNGMKKNESGKPVLAVDWGMKRLGLAVSDLTWTLARPLDVIKHISRRKDAEKILKIAQENNAGMIIIGVTFDDNRTPTHNGQSAMRLLEEIKSLGSIPVTAWDEEGSTRAAISSRVEMGSSRKKRKEHLDSIAAAIFLQNFLDSESEK
jgi:putative Holliday junction resolvase